MIKVAEDKDREELFRLWKHSFLTKERSELKYYFDYCFGKGQRKCLKIEQDERIVSCLHMQVKNMNFQKHTLQYTYLYGIATHPDYRRRKHMRRLLQSALDEASHTTLLTLVKAEHPKLFENFGFETVYEHKQYAIHHKYFEQVTTDQVFYNYKPEELLEMYEKFQKVFDGYEVRTLQYFIDLDKLTFLHRSDICVCRNEKGEVEGYAWYSEHEDHVVVHEVTYTGSLVLKKMLKFICKEHTYIHVEVSMNEALEKLFPMTIPTKKKYMMVRLNQPELFNKLYMTEVKSAQSAYRLLEKPLWINDVF